MSLVEVIDDLLALDRLAADEEDPVRRRSLDRVKGHVAQRDKGAKVSEAAEALGISQPTVRAWLDAGLLTAVAATKPVRIDVLSVADVKRALDLVRESRQLLVQVTRVLRDREALAASEEGFADLAAGRVVPLGDDLQAEIARLQRRERSRSKSR